MDVPDAEWRRVTDALVEATQTGYEIKADRDRLAAEVGRLDVLLEGTVSDLGETGRLLYRVEQERDRLRAALEELLTALDHTYLEYTGDFLSAEESARDALAAAAPRRSWTSRRRHTRRRRSS